MSMYADYVRERLGDEVLELGYGFATYRFLNENKTVYIVDIYVKPEHRKKNVASEIADKIVDIAKQRGAVELIGTVSPQLKSATTSLKVLLGYGMQLHSASEQAIILKKEI